MKKTAIRRSGVGKRQSLAELIRKLRGDLNGDLELAINKFIDEIHGTLKILSENNNLKVYDNEKGKGGIIRGPMASRAKYEIKENGNLRCNRMNRDLSKLEVPYFRAVFNSNKHTLNVGTDSAPTIRLIGYEAPLMRKRKGDKNIEIGSRAVSCDLIGLSPDNHVWCIEGKVKAESNSTDMVYGILESFAYGICLQFVLKNHPDKIKNEVEQCLKEFHGKEMNQGQKLSAKYALAGPRDYFCEFLKEEKHKSLSEAQMLLNVLNSKFSPDSRPAWGGFLVFNHNTDEIDWGSPVKEIEPTFKKPLVANLANDLAGLKERCLSATEI